jgi:hypothetical protein
MKAVATAEYVQQTPRVLSIAAVMRGQTGYANDTKEREQ